MAADMKIHLLRYFVVLAEELHFGRAAQRLAITQPPLSSALKALEDELGVRLLERNSKQVSLTPAGAAYLAHARLVLERLATARDAALAVAAGMRGRLELGLTGSMVYREVPRIVETFGARCPDIEVHLREMSTADQLEALGHGQLHAGFLNAKALPPTLAGLPLADDRLVCCVPEGHALAQAKSIDLQRLAQENFVMFARDVAPANYDNVIAVFNRAGIHPRTRHAARQWLTVVAMVAGGLGVALVPASLARAGMRGVSLVPVRGLVPLTVGALAWRREDAGAAALAAFIAVAREVLGVPPLRARSRG
jgi:DNA-binding transcriptional LysR family regulator